MTAIPPPSSAFHTLMWSAARAEEALGWAVALHERISAAGVRADALMQLADRAGLGDWDLGDVLSCLAAFEKRTGLAPDLHFVQLLQPSSPAQTHLMGCACNTAYPRPVLAGR